MIKERKHAKKYKTLNPVFTSKKETDASFHHALNQCFENLDRIFLYVGSHNEKSMRLFLDLFNALSKPEYKPRVMAAQLYGMSDNLSYNLAAEGAPVCKLIPYGPVKKVIPYLIRRAQENTSVLGESSRELKLLKKELKKKTNKKIKSYNIGI